MENHYDPELEAEASMRLAVAADGAERQKWISLAIPDELKRMEAAIKISLPMLK
jgi:hypothetical protein